MLFLAQAFGRNQIGIAKIEYRMSNKEVRMMKFKNLDSFLRRSTFGVRYSAVRF